MDKLIENICLLIYFTGQVIFLYLKAFAFLILPKPRKSLKNEIILTTGSANGLGKEICKKLAPSGATLVLWDISQESNEELRFELENLGAHRVIPETVDISNRFEIVEAAARIRRTLGPITMIINNAGIAPVRPFSDLTAPQIQKCFDVNVLSHFWICQEFLPDMMSANKGHIVTICSTMGLMGMRGSLCYNSSKHAVHGFIESLKDEVYHTKENCEVKFTTAYPFFIKTKMVQEEVTGVKMKFRFPLLCPFMEVDYVAEEIVKGILQEREYIYLPESFRIYFAVKFLLTSEIERAYHDLNVEQLEYSPIEIPKGN